jgi:hypothetical protein
MAANHFAQHINVMLNILAILQHAITWLVSRKLLHVETRNTLLAKFKHKQHKQKASS